MLPNEFLFDLSVRNPKALYVIISQSGTSIVAHDCLRYAKSKGFLTAALCASDKVPIAGDAEIFIDMGCGFEEHPTITIGYVTAVLTLMLLGMEIGKERGFLAKAKYDEYIKYAYNLPDSVAEIIDRSLVWMDKAKRKMLRSTAIVFTGAGSLFGVANEGSVKAWEIPQIPSMSYELEEGLHGANYGYNHNHCVIVLNDGGRENEKALSLAKYMREVFKNGYIIGKNVIDDTDFPLDYKSGAFMALEFAAAVQVLVYRLGLDGGRDLSLPHDNHVMYSYFTTHSDYKKGNHEK
jgi:glucosamine 6-phosphate synthetase-like amidotransferase/phosphosugar isomerase protein